MELEEIIKKMNGKAEMCAMMVLAGDNVTAKNYAIEYYELRKIRDDKAVELFNSL